MFKEIIENKLGIKDFESYKAYKKNKYENGITIDDIELLSPDNIDNQKFWEYIDSTMFKIDTVSNVEELEHKDISLDEIHKHSIQLAGLNGSLIPIFDPNVKSVLEIGTGFGSLQNFLNQRFPEMQYSGVDIFPRSEGVFKIGNDCIFPDEILNQKFDLIISSNVFQHLSLNQRRTYYKQVKKLLNPFGYFSFSNGFITAPDFGFHCKENNKRYMCHYGQYTEIQSIYEFQKDMNDYGFGPKVITRYNMNHYSYVVGNV